MTTILSNLARGASLLLLIASVPGVATSIAATPTNGVAKPSCVTLYVSKLGNNSNGLTWTNAFHTIQAALDAIPNTNGGHRIIVRPDVYDEANLAPAHRGVLGAYNVIEGDWDGSLGSGTNGWVVVDSGAPLAVVRTDTSMPMGNPGFKIVNEGDPSQETGFKSIDWWTPWKCTPTFSGVAWDRWTFRRIYSAGSECGFGWDMTTEPACEFSAIVEDCVGIGRFAGGAVMGHVNRPTEPVIFRRSYLVCCDIWGDAGGVYVRAHNPAPPVTPDAIFEDCTIVSPDNAVQVGYPNFSLYTRIQFTRCKLFVLNFSQPVGTPASGVIYSDLPGKCLHVDLEDCTLAGYKAFGARKEDFFSYTLKGTNRAYVQFRQPVPKGFERLRFWPIDVFNELTPTRFLGQK